MTQETIEKQIWRLLTSIFRRRAAYEHWLNTHNLLLEGECPYDLMNTDEGQHRVLVVLKEMAGE